MYVVRVHGTAITFPRYEVAEFQNEMETYDQFLTQGQADGLYARGSDGILPNPGSYELQIIVERVLDAFEIL